MHTHLLYALTWMKLFIYIYYNTLVRFLFRKLLMLSCCFIKVEMTGDYTPDLMALLSADIIISTPEKWDGISRNWHSRSYVTKVYS